MESEHSPTVAPARPLDLDAIERDLADVEVALARLDAGTYWTDEVTGEALPDELLASRPTARRTTA
jgi:RNA polymerase-binding transcription factor DksA